MPCWYYEKKELESTPSIQDGITYETEQRYRKEGARFIINVGTKMDLGYSTMATGVVYFHRFYMFHSFRQFPRYVTACCCLFLAGKVEETPKKCNDIIKIAKGLLSDQHFQTFGEDPKEEVMTLERILLQTIKFDLQVEHPYSYLLKYAKCLKGDKNKLQKMVQMAWTFVNDSLCTTLSLQWEPEVIAVALMYLSGKLSKFEVQDWAGRQPKHLRWWDMFVEDVTLGLLEDICHQVLDLYSQPQTSNTPDSPPLRPRSPPTKKPRLEQPTSPGVPHHSPAPTVIPAKGTKMETKAGLTPAAVGSIENIPVNDREVPLLPKGGENTTFLYGHGGPAHPPAFPPSFTAPVAEQALVAAAAAAAAVAAVNSQAATNSAPPPPPPPSHLTSAPPPSFPPFPPPFTANAPPPLTGQYFASGPPARPF